MNNTKRYALISLICLRSALSNAMLPTVGSTLLTGIKGFCYVLGTAVSLPEMAIGYLTKEHQNSDYQPPSAQEDSQLSIRNIAPQLGKGPAIIVTVNNNNQQTPASFTTGSSESFSESLSHQAQRSFTWLRSNKLITGVLGTAGIYAGLQSYLWYLARYLTHKDRWASWKKNFSLEDLYALDTDDLLKELVREMSQRLGQQDHFTNLQHVIHQITKEITLHRRYKMLSTYARLKWIRKFFFISDTLFETIDDRIQRLIYLKSIVTTWLTQQHKQYQTLFA